ncbi:MAG: thioredoxin [Sulfurifustaceae bacterium]
MLAETPAPPPSDGLVKDTTTAAFRQDVIQESLKQPVLVDFWAPWCGPCRVLMPLLAKLAAEYEGKFFLAKVNTDVEQELAMEYQIRGIPAVKLFRDGKVAGEFVGVQPESAIRALIDRFVPREIDAILERVSTLERDGKHADAAALLRQAVEKDPHDDRAKIELARRLVALPAAEDLDARADEAARLLDSLTLRAGANPDVEALRARLALLRVAAGAPPLDVLERAVAADANDHVARHRLAARLALDGRYEPAMEHFLELVRHNRNYGDEAGRKGMLAVFNLAGSRDPAVTKYRGLLARTLN